jgi:hypothetical protein
MVSLSTAHKPTPDLGLIAVQAATGKSSNRARYAVVDPRKNLNSESQYF